MKRQRTLQPAVESLEIMTLLSTGVIPHAAPDVAAVVNKESTTNVHLSGGIASGRGYVAPLGVVKGQYILVDKTLTLSNKHGALELQLSQMHRSTHLVQFRAWQIIHGTGQYATWHGSGSGVFSLVIVGKRAVASSAAFF